MANAVRIRVEIKKKYNDPYKNYKEMFRDFKKRVENSKILHDYKDHSRYESKSEKKRKEKRISQKKILVDSLTKKIEAGEDVREPVCLVRKIKQKLKKDRIQAEQFEQYRKYEDGGSGYED